MDQQNIKKIPYLKDLVIAEVVKITNFGAYCKLIEYNNVDAFELSFPSPVAHVQPAILFLRINLNFMRSVFIALWAICSNLFYDFHKILFVSLLIKYWLMIEYNKAKILI